MAASPASLKPRYLARFITQGNGLDWTDLNQTKAVPCKTQDPPGRSALADQACNPGPPARGRRVSRLGRGRLGAGRNFRDGLQDLGRDLVGVALRVRAAVFQIALVSVVDEGVRNADRRAAVGHAIAELVPGRGLVLAGQALVVVRPVDG